MPLFSFEGKTPQVADDAFVAPTATVVGDVVIESGASVWYGAVVRGDYARVTIGAGANVQDNAVLHAPPGLPCTIGPGVTVAHNCVVHGCTVGEEALIANGAVVLDGASIGARTMIAAGAIVKAGDTIPDEVVAMGAPAKVRGPIADTPSEFWVKVNPQAYRELAVRHRDGVEEIS